MLHADAKTTGISIAASTWTAKFDTHRPEPILPKTASLRKVFGAVK